MSDVSGILKENIKSAVSKSIGKVSDYAVSTHKFISKNGHLEQSVKTDITSDGMAGTVFLDENIAGYAPYVHNGTRPHLITPRNRKVLRWAGKGGFVFSKYSKHPGYAGDPFLYVALDNNESEIKRIFDEEVDTTVNQIVMTFSK